MTPDHIRHLLGGYATGTLNEQEKRLLFEAALSDQELFNQIASDESLRDLLEDPSTRGYLLSALEEEVPVPSVLDSFPAAEISRRKQSAAAPAGPEFARASRPLQRQSMPPTPLPIWRRFGALAATVVVLAGATIFGIRRLNESSSGSVEIAGTPKPLGEAQPATTPTSVRVPAPAAPPVDRETPRPLREGAAATTDTESLEAKRKVTAPAPRVIFAPAEKEAAPSPANESDKQTRKPEDSDRLADRAASAPPRPALGTSAEAQPAVVEQRAVRDQITESVIVEPASPRMRRAPVPESPDGSRQELAAVQNSAANLYQYELNQRQQLQPVQNQGRLLRDQQFAGIASAELRKDAERARSAAKRAESQKERPGLAGSPPAAAPAAGAEPKADRAGAGGSTAVVEFPGIRFQVQRRNPQGGWTVVLPTAAFGAGDEVALYVEQNVPGNLQVFYQDASLNPVSLALLDAGTSGKRTAPFKLLSGPAQFTIVLRGASATVVPAPPASQVTQTDGPTNYVVRPNAPQNSPVVAKISLNVR